MLEITSYISIFMQKRPAFGMVFYSYRVITREPTLDGKAP